MGDEKPLLTYDAVEVGQALGPISYRVEPELVRTHLEALGLGVPRFLVDPASGTLLIDPTVLLRNHIRLLRSRFRAEGALHARTEVSLLRAARSGQTVTVTGRVADKYERRGRAWIVVDSTTSDEEGREISRARDTLALPTRSA